MHCSFNDFSLSLYRLSPRACAAGMLLSVLQWTFIHIFFEHAGKVREVGITDPGRNRTDGQLGIREQPGRHTQSLLE